LIVYESCKNFHWSPPKRAAQANDLARGSSRQHRPLQAVAQGGPSTIWSI
jgi:hypothetical protein